MRAEYQARKKQEEEQKRKEFQARTLEHLKAIEKERKEQEAAGKTPRPVSSRSPLLQLDDDDYDSLLDGAWVLTPRAEHKHTIVWFHGLDEDQKNASAMFQMISPEDIRVVVPNAPKYPLTSRDEQLVRAWWDFEDGELQGVCWDEEEDTAGIRETHESVLRLLQHEESLIASENILLAGFGQGGALALHTMLRHPRPLAGVVTFAGWLPDAEAYPDAIQDANTGTQVVAYQGKDDNVVRLDDAMEGWKELRSFGQPVDVRVVPRMGHYVDQAQWVQAYDWIVRHLKSGKR